MSAEPARASRPLQEVLDQMSANHRAAIDATRSRLAEVPQPQGQPVGLEAAGQLPVGATPNMAAKDLVYRYGRESAPALDRAPVMEPDR